jgi:hypothetical protein
MSQESESEPRRVSLGGGEGGRKTRKDGMREREREL